MSPFVLSVLKYSLLVLLYFFIYRAVRSVASGLSGRTGTARADRAPTGRAPASRGRRPPSSVVVHAGSGARTATIKLHGPVEVQALAHGAGRRQHLVGAQVQMHGRAG